MRARIRGRRDVRTRGARPRGRGRVYPPRPYTHTRPPPARHPPFESTRPHDHVEGRATPRVPLSHPASPTNSHPADRACTRYSPHPINRTVAPTTLAQQHAQHAPLPIASHTM